jgi:hypothetical protein
MRISMTRGNRTVAVKEKDITRFLAEGWTMLDSNPAKKVSKIGTAKATADVIEEVNPLEEEEDNWTFSLEDTSMPKDKQGDD